MDKSKFLPIVFLIIILGVGFVAYKFYNDNQILVNENQNLKKEKTELSKDNGSLKSKYDTIAKEKKDLEERWSKVEDELSRLEQDNNRWQKKYENIFKERDDLLAKLESLKALPRYETMERTMDSQESTTEAKPLAQDYWVDFVKIKAQLEAELESLKQDYLNAKNDILKLETENKEFSIKYDEIVRGKAGLEREIAFKTRTIDIMSRDIVNEREDRQKMILEVDQLRKENADLKQEVILGNKEKMQMQNVMKEASDKKQNLERKVSEVENLLKEKSLVFEELKDQLNRAVGTEVKQDDISKKSTAVELPPIVVKPEAGALKGFCGEVIAVNREEKFVVLDLGEASGIKPGVQLNVMRENKVIGLVEVIETRKEISAADIKESKTTIKESDIVVSK